MTLKLAKPTGASLKLAKPTGAKLVYAKTYVGIDDLDAATYIAAVETADGQSLETAVKVAIHSFVKGCKADGIWPAIKASCILAGARTLSGALVPLAGTAPTNNNFVSGDYNRKTGLAGNGSTKYLNSNRAGNADPQNSAHASVYRTDTASLGTASFLGSQMSNGDRNVTFYTLASGFTGYAIRKTAAAPGDPAVAATSSTPGLLGVSRPSASSQEHRVAGVTTTSSISSIAPDSTAIYVFANNTSGTLATPTAARLAFYSIGESLNLALLNARVTTMINAFGAAIP